MQDKLDASEGAREYAETHQKIVRVPVKENVLYEKCRKCHKGKYDTALVGFVAYSLLVTIFAAVKSKVLENVLYWLIVVVIVSAVIGGIGFGVYVGARKVREVYMECCWDRVSIMVATISLAVVVYFGEETRTVVPVNLVVMMLMVHGVYVGVRKNVVR